MYKRYTKVTGKISPEVKLIRTAAYARVSSDKDAMLNSLSAQVSYYSELIQANPEWKFIGVYVDEALTGTKDNRPEFQRLIADCRSGLIDLILVKSISRFARNTVTLLETVRELKRLGVDVFFEREDIHTLSAEGELMLTLIAAVAQEESRSVSENCKWRIRRQFMEGDLSIVKRLYGYRRERGELVIVLENAMIVRRIFREYNSGIGPSAIARQLTAEGIPTSHGGQWTGKRILDMLRNEKYTGDALLQKTYILDHVSKRKVRNVGQLPKYYASEALPAIIDRDLFDVVQARIKMNGKKYRAGETPRQEHAFTGMIRCEICGKHLIRKKRHDTYIWSCSTYQKCGRGACGSKAIPEQTLSNLCLEALSLSKLNEDQFRAGIQFLIAKNDHHVVFVFKDGTERSLRWTERSRKDSWTADMCEQARICGGERCKK